MQLSSRSEWHKVQTFIVLSPRTDFFSCLFCGFVHLFIMRCDQFTKAEFARGRTPWLLHFHKPKSITVNEIHCTWRKGNAKKTDNGVSSKINEYKVNTFAWKKSPVHGRNKANAGLRKFYAQVLLHAVLRFTRESTVHLEKKFQQNLCQLCTENTHDVPHQNTSVGPERYTKVYSSTSLARNRGKSFIQLHKTPSYTLTRNFDTILLYNSFNFTQNSFSCTPQ